MIAVGVISFIAGVLFITAILLDVSDEKFYIIIDKLKELRNGKV